MYRVKKIISVIFASVIFLLEEIQNVFVFYKECRKIQLLAEKQNIFKNLSAEEKDQVKKFYNAKIQELDKAQKLICREATVQVALQLTLILYQEIFNKSSFTKKVNIYTRFIFDIYEIFYNLNYNIYKKLY